MIDKNRGVDFPETLLKEWKRSHELWIRTNLNKQQLNNSQVISNNQRNGITANSVTIMNSTEYLNTSEFNDRKLFSYSEKLLGRNDITFFNDNVTKDRIYKHSISKIRAFVEGFLTPELEYIDPEIEKAKTYLIDRLSSKLLAFEKKVYFDLEDMGDFYQLSFKEKREGLRERGTVGKLVYKVVRFMGLLWLIYDEDTDRLEPWWCYKKKEQFIIDIESYNTYRRRVKKNLFI